MWRFEDLHNAEAPPAFIHRLKNTEVKHVGSVGEHLLLVNNSEDNVDVYGVDSPQVLKTLDIQGRQMNCSAELRDHVVIGCRDRRIYVFNK